MTHSETHADNHEVVCAGCGRRDAARPVAADAIVRGVIPAFELLPHGWRLILGVPSQATCSQACSDDVWLRLRRNGRF